MPEVVELREVTDRRDVIHRAVQRLLSGNLVVLPSEAGFVLAGAALVEGTSQRLRPDGIALLLRATDEVADYLPLLSPVGLRIAKRCWPGPLVLQAPATATDGFVAALPESSRWAVLAAGQLSVRVSSHPVLSEVAKLCRGPLLFRELPAPTKTTDFTTEPWSSAALIVTEPPSTESKSAESKLLDALPSIVRVDEFGNWSAERIGATPESKLQVAACELILFCCTGNTCRSPMAECLFRHLLSERLKCSPDELTQRGFLVASAGLAADYGSAASHESVEVMKRRGLNLRSHSSQPVTDRLIDQADRCYTMTRRHRDAILDSRPELAPRVQVLARDNGDISDPIGAGLNEYAACAASIERHLAQILDEIV